MASRFSNVTHSFRKTFTLPDMDVVKWFPGHMQKGVLKVQHMLKNIDCVIEVHDARIPFSGRNPRFNDIISLRPHVLVYNKMDLCNLKRKPMILSKLKSEGVDNVMFTQSTVSTKNTAMSRDLYSLVTKAIEARSRYHRAEINEFNLLILGVPNIGKSTFLNYLRRLNTTHHKKAASVGAKAGVTKSVGNKVRVNFDPPIFLTDSPGILTPTVPNIHVGMKLALCGCMPDHYVGEEYIVDYMLYWMNKQQQFGYVKYFDLKEPTDDVMPFLKHVALKNKMIKKIKSTETRRYVHIPDFNGAANIVIKSFRSGDLGKFMLDDDLL